MAAPPLATRLPFELHVANIPADLTRDGMFNLFGKYGEVTEVYLRELTPTLLLSPSPTALEYFFFATPAKFGLFHFSDSPCFRQPQQRKRGPPLGQRDLL
jgi:hypothetical protein